MPAAAATPTDGEQARPGGAAGEASAHGGRHRRQRASTDSFCVFLFLGEGVETRCSCCRALYPVCWRGLAEPTPEERGRTAGGRRQPTEESLQRRTTDRPPSSPEQRTRESLAERRLRTLCVAAPVLACSLRVLAVLALTLFAGRRRCHCGGCPGSAARLFAADRGVRSPEPQRRWTSRGRCQSCPSAIAPPQADLEPLTPTGSAISRDSSSTTTRRRSKSGCVECRVMLPPRWPILASASRCDMPSACTRVEWVWRSSCHAILIPSPAAIGFSIRSVMFFSM